MKRWVAVLALLLLGLAQAHEGRAQTPAAASGDELKALRQEVESLREGQQAMQRDLQEIKRLLLARGAAPQPAPPAVVNAGSGPFLGNRDARVVIVDFSDYQCPFCGRFFRETMPQLQEEYIKTGKVKYVFRDLPLESIHPYAFKAAEATRCAGEQGKFWELHYRLFQNQQALDAASLPLHAQALGLDVPKFNACLGAGRHAAEVRQDMAEAAEVGLQGTPSFIIAVADPSAKGAGLRVLRTIVGAQPYATFKAAIDAALAQPARP